MVKVTSERAIVETVTVTVTVTAVVPGLSLTRLHSALTLSCDIQTLPFPSFLFRLPPLPFPFTVSPVIERHAAHTD